MDLLIVSTTLFKAADHIYVGVRTCTVQYIQERVHRRYDMNGRSQLKGGKNWILLKELNTNHSSETLIGWKFGKTTYVPLCDRKEGAWLYNRLWMRRNTVERDYLMKCHHCYCLYINIKNFEECGREETAI